ncbi:hypothetical protein BC829DRAFT_393240 [Chytridium lagenaria]|nr:hypothetical protein BC829DRAFT_393240 [Chytridium lagenaria]
MAASTQQFWNSTNCGVGTLCIEKWDPIGTYSVWIIVSKGILTEGTLSLIITLISMAILVLLFFIHNYHWNPSYDARTPEEKLAWLTNGNVVVGIANALLLWILKKARYQKTCPFINILNTKRAFRNSILGIFIWIFVSLISSVAQLSIHSVTALQQTFVSVRKVSLPALNLSHITSGVVPPQFTENFGGSERLNFTYPVPLHVNIGYALLSGIAQNLSSYAFSLDGNVCSGQLFYDTTLRTRCLLDATTCVSDKVVWSTLPNDTEKFSRRFIDQGMTSNFGPSPSDVLNISNLIILNTKTSPVTRRKISSVSLKYFLRSRGSVSFPNSSLWEVFDYDEEWMEPVYDKPTNVTEYTTPYRIKSEFNTVDYWQGTCNHKIQLCDVKRFSTAGISAGSMTMCDASVGIGEIWRTNFMISNTGNILLQGRTFTESYALIQSIIGRIGLAWSVSSIPWAQTFCKIGQVEVNDKLPVEAIAMDFILVFLLLLLLAGSMAWAGYLVFLTRDATSSISISVNERRQLWDPVYKYMAEMRSSSIATEGTQLLGPDKKM